MTETRGGSRTAAGLLVLDHLGPVTAGLNQKALAS